MSRLKKLRESLGLSQRKLALSSGLSFRTIQMIESEKGNITLNTLSKISTALGYEIGEFRFAINEFFTSRPNSIKSVSRRIAINPDSWKNEVAQLVDNIRRERDLNMIVARPVESCPENLTALLAAIVESICLEINLTNPLWTKEIRGLAHPWFVAGIENLKASALLESPLLFRRRNIFVLENFLNRA